MSKSHKLNPAREKRQLPKPSFEAGKQATGGKNSPKPPIDPVEEASDESFPASDPPAWTATAASKDHED